MSRILAVDYGKKRCGIAVTDPLKIIAGGLATVATSELLSFIKDYTTREQVETIVVGEPKQPNGQPSENLPPVEYYDERFTSVLAHKAMIDGGLKKKARQNKALVDEISATIILQDYMNSKRFS